jgi:hypothetical protein
MKEICKHLVADKKKIRNHMKKFINWHGMNYDKLRLRE